MRMLANWTCIEILATTMFLKSSRQQLSPQSGDTTFKALIHQFHHTIAVLLWPYIRIYLRNGCNLTCCGKVEKVGAYCFEIDFNEKMKNHFSSNIVAISYLHEEKQTRRGLVVYTMDGLVCWFSYSDSIGLAKLKTDIRFISGALKLITCIYYIWLILLSTDT